MRRRRPMAIKRRARHTPVVSHILGVGIRLTGQMMVLIVVLALVAILLALVAPN